MILSHRHCRALIGLLLLANHGVYAANVREHTRLTGTDGTKVTQSQAVDLTLTLSETSIRPIQTWIRTAASIDRKGTDKNGKTLSATVYAPDAGLVQVGQRVRAFPLESKSSMYQAKITRVTTQANHSAVEVTLASQGRENSEQYLLEIVVERGEFLSVPNEAIIEEGDKQVVYVQRSAGDYAPREVVTGHQGELYTQVLKGLAVGEQVVTLGSFFIDSEYKMKGNPE